MTDGDLVRAGRTVRAMAGTEETQEVRPKRDWSLNNWGMRLVYSIAAGWVVNLALDTYALGTVIAVVLFVLTTAIVTVGRRR